MKIEAKNIGFGFHKETVFQDISFANEKGEVMAVLGPNGIGKTTLLRCVLGFLKPRSGSLLYDGKPMGRDFWQRVAYVPQARSQVFAYRCEEMVLLGRSAALSMFQMPSRHDEELAQKAMEEAGILHLKGKNCNEISGGELQLVLIARALAIEPEVLVMDEPETGLDFRNQLMVLRMIEKLSNKGMSILFNTHYPGHAAEIADKVLLMNKQGGALFGKASEILNEKNMREAFGVRILMREEYVEGKKRMSIIPLDEQGA